MPGNLCPRSRSCAHQVVAAAVRQPQIADEQVEGVLAGQFQRRGHVAGRFDRVASAVSTIRIIFAVTPWSSTSKIRKGRTACCGDAAGAGASGRPAGAVSGSRTRNVAPLSRPSLWA